MSVFLSVSLSFSAIQVDLLDDNFTETPGDHAYLIFGVLSLGQGSINGGIVVFH